MNDFSSSGYTFFDILWLLFTILCVVGILAASYYGSRFVAKHMANSANGSKMSVLDKLVLAQDKYVAAIKVGDKAYLIGVSQQSITMLGEIDEHIFDDLATAETSMPMPFAEMLSKAKQATLSHMPRGNKDDSKH